MNWFAGLSRVVAAAALIAGSGCKAGDNPFADDDNDGWFTKDNNWATVLTLTSATFTAPGSYRILVDQVRFPVNPTLDGTVTAVTPGTIPLGFAVAKRLHGTDIHRPTTRAQVDYRSQIRVVRTGPPPGDLEIGSVALDYHSVGGQTLSAAVGTAPGPIVSLSFATSSNRFADPTPNDSRGDVDGDGITECEEAKLAESFGGLGDPRPGGIDLLLVVGHSEPQWALDPLTTELLRSRFFQRSINLHIDDGTLNGRPGSGGLVTVAGSPVTPGTSVSLAMATSVHASQVPGPFNRPSYFALLGPTLVEGGFGIADLPGRNLAVRAQLPPLAPNFFNYQAGVLMHEFGHTLSLCHPTLHTGAGACPAIPVAERDPGASVMGAPSEDPGLGGVPNVIINALRRPLDYGPAQWGLIRPGAGFPPVTAAGGC
jgi:hypothetical protein